MLDLRPEGGRERSERGGGRARRAGASIDTYRPGWADACGTVRGGPVRVRAQGLGDRDRRDASLVVVSGCMCRETTPRRAVCRAVTDEFEKFEEFEEFESSIVLKKEFR